MLKKELKKELNRTKLILDYAREEIKVKDKEIKQLKSQSQQKENIIEELKERSLRYSKQIDGLLEIKEEIREKIKWAYDEDEYQGAIYEIEQIIDKEVN